jgi:hypothetical protein
MKETLMRKNSFIAPIIMILTACNLPSPAPSRQIQTATLFTGLTSTPAETNAISNVTPDGGVTETITSPGPPTGTFATAPILIGFYAEGAGNIPSGLLLGGSQGGRWLRAGEVEIVGGEPYRLYTNAGFVGTATGSAPYSATVVCPSDRNVDLYPVPETGREVIAIGGEWNALPRAVETLANDLPVYLEIVRGQLTAHGLDYPEPILLQTLRTDLDGDSQSEVLLVSYRFETEAVPQISAGDYSLVLLLDAAGGDETLVPLVADYYLENQAPAAANRYSIAGILDLNGDGRMEIVVRGLRYEGTTDAVFEWDGANAQPALVHDCGSYKSAKPVPSNDI